MSAGYDENFRLVWTYDDGGRRGADTGDCVVRAIAIAAKLDYEDVYSELARGMELKGKPRSCRKGVLPSVYKPYMEELGFAWTPTMQVGSGCQVHCRADELPGGTLILRLSRHVCAFVDGVIRDTFDPSREGTRCVYGYWSLQV